MPVPVILFGAFDRHNLGDLLLAHVAAALLPGRELVFAGLADRDLRPFGGHRVHALHRLAAQGRLHDVHLLHVGGEILSCSARQAAVMLLRPQDVDGVLATLEREPALEPSWRSRMLGTGAPAPYVAGRDELPGVARMLFTGVGGVGIGALPAAERAAVLRRLADADDLSVRDATTLATLRAAGIAATLVPDPVAAIGRLFDAPLHARAGQGPVAAMAAAFERGFVAVQLSAEFGDDAGLDVAARELSALAARTGLGIVLFRAGAAPWHDDLEVLARLATRLPPPAVRIFESLDAWDTCALLSRARACAGSSLHATIVATACGVPAAAIVRPDDPGQSAKLAAYLDTWHEVEEARCWPLERLREGVETALATDPRRRAEAAARRARAYCTAFERSAAILEGSELR